MNPEPVDVVNLPGYLFDRQVNSRSRSRSVYLEVFPSESPFESDRRLVPMRLSIWHLVYPCVLLLPLESFSVL